MDAETRGYLANVVGAEHDIPEALRSRLTGDSVSELRADAQALAKQIGATPEPEGGGGRSRDETGRFTGDSMSDMIRRAAGRA